MLRQFLKDSAVYGLASILVRSVSLLLVPFYTRVLVPADYGIVDLLAVFTSFVGVTVALEVSQAVARFFPDTDDLAERTAYASTSLWFSLGAYTAFLVPCLLLADPLSVRLLGTSGHEQVFRVAMAATWLSGVFFLVQSQLRYSLRPARYAIASLMFSVTSIATTVVLVLLLRMGVIGILYGQVVGGAVGLAIGLRFSSDVYRPTFDAHKLRMMLRFSMPLVPSSVGVMVGLYVDRIAIARLMTLGDVGLFGVGYRLSSLTSLLMVGFVSALTPLIYARHREPDTPAQLARIFRTFAALALAVCLALALFARDIVAVATTPDYVGAAAVVPLLAPALVLSSMYIFAPGPGIAKRTGIISTINIGVAVMNTLLNFLLIPILGILGAATATFLSNATGFSVNMVASQRLYPVPHDWRRLGLAALGTIVLFVLGASDIVAGMASVALRGAIMVLAATWFVTVGLISPGELRGLLRQAGRARRLTARSTVPSDDAEDGHRSL